MALSRIGLHILVHDNMTSMLDLHYGLRRRFTLRLNEGTFYYRLRNSPSYSIGISKLISMPLFGKLASTSLLSAFKSHCWTGHLLLQQQSPRLQVNSSLN